MNGTIAAYAVLPLPNHRLGNYLHNRRSERGWTQKYLAQALDVSPQYLNDLEHGRRELPQNRIPTLAFCLNVNADYLYYLTGHLPPDVAHGDHDETAIVAGMQAIRDKLARRAGPQP